MSDNSKDASDSVSRRRYNREQAARQEAEFLLEEKSRELFAANQRLNDRSERLEAAVRQRTAELELAVEQAEAAGKAKSRFIATMSHEIRTPLGGMLGMIDLLAMDESEPAKLELLNYAATAGNSLSRIVNDVLDFSKMEAGVFVYDVENVDVRALIESIKMLALNNEKTEHRKIIVKVDSSVPQVFLGDGTRVRQVISNLISNALRYSTDGPVLVRAHATDHEKGALVRIEVEDFGVGIPEESLESLFKDFSQVENPLTAAAQGAGLGLAICKRILEGCGGTLGVESQIGEGTTFWLELPVVIGQQSESDGQPMSLLQQKDILDGKRVLIAEDNIINQKLLLTYAERLNLSAVLAENGRIALEKFNPEQFDLVLMDIAMPEMDGLEATRQIRLKWAETDMPPIIALTAHVMDAIGEEAAIVGINEVLSKPIRFEELKLALEKCLSAKQHEKGNVVAATDPQPQVAAPADSTAIFAKMAAGKVSELLSMLPEERLVELVKKYVSDTGERLIKIAEAIARDDTTTVLMEAHSVKGASMMLGFTDIGEMARQIEEAQAEPETQKKTVDVMKIEIELLKNELG